MRIILNSLDPSGTLRTRIILKVAGPGRPLSALRMILILGNAAACLPSLRTRIILNKAAAWGCRPAGCLGAPLTVWASIRLAYRCKPPGPSVVAVLLRDLNNFGLGLAPCRPSAHIGCKRRPYRNPGASLIS